MYHLAFALAAPNVRTRVRAVSHRIEAQGLGDHSSSGGQLGHLQFYTRIREAAVRTLSLLP